MGEIAKGNSYGVLLHPMLAVDAQSGDSLGLVAGEIWTRQGRQVIAHDKRAASERESRRGCRRHWRQAVLSAASMVTVIGDRESDIYGAWGQVPEAGFHLLSRSMQDRALVGDGYLDATVAALPVADRRTLELVERAGRPTRVPGWNALRRSHDQTTAQMRSRLPEGVRLRVVEVERTQPAGRPGTVALVLLTTHQVETPDEAWQIVAWYKLRWTIEQLFRTLKKQGLQLEDSQVEPPTACSSSPPSQPMPPLSSCSSGSGP